MVDTQVTLYQRSYRTFFKALICREKAIVLRYDCCMWSYSSIVHNASMISYDLIFTPVQCLEANKTGKIKITVFGVEEEIDIKHRVSKLSCHNRGTFSEKYSPNSCDDRGQMNHYSFETLIGQIVLDIDNKGKAIYNSQEHKVPCSLSDGGCSSTSLDPFVKN